MVEARKDGGAAFPLSAETMTDCEGMSLRDYFAIHVDVGGYEFPSLESAARILGIDGAPESPADTDAMFRFSVKIQAAVRYRLADAMLAARANGGSQP